MKKILAILILLIVANLYALPYFELEEFQDGKYVELSKVLKTSEANTVIKDGISVNIKPVLHKELNEYEVKVENSRKKIALLRIRFKAESGSSGGGFWDGFEYHSDLQKTFIPKTDRYNFPAVAYLYGGNLISIGFAPWTVSSRFARHCEIKDGRAILCFDAYIALNPSESVKSGFFSGEIKNAFSYTEAVETVYNTWADYFRPVKGTDERLYGVGGYMRSSSDPENREYYQLEDNRRRGFDWEWYYNSYQKAGDFFPSPEYWDDKQGYKSEKSHATCDTPGSVDDWKNNHRYRTNAGNKTSALFYYYMQQYLNCDLLKNFFKDSAWVDEKGKPGYRAFNWGDEGWSEYAWSGEHSSFGAEVRKDLSMLWENFDIAGFALDCVSGDQKYYGPLVLRESNRAFDDNGKIFVLEGVAIAYNLDYTHKFPAKSDNRRPASVVNEPYHYLTIFHSDAAIHEMPPFEREDKIAPRRLQLGQKPYFWWTTWKIKDLLAWDKLSSDEINKALTGIMDHIIMMSLRYGAVPSAIDSFNGFPDMFEWRDTFKLLQRTGWRAAPYAWVDGIPGIETPWAKDAPIWVSRFGDSENSYIVLSIPDPAGMKGKLRIYTGKFNSAGAIYADVKGKKSTNTITENETVIDFDLKGHEPLVLRKVGQNGNGTISAQIMSDDKNDFQIIICKDNAEPLIKYEHAAIKFIPEPKTKWISQLCLSDGKKSFASIVGVRGEIEEVGTPARQLEIYMEYFYGRRARADQPIFRMVGHFNPALRFPLLSINDSKIPESKTLFILGSDARRKYFPDVKATDTIICKQENGQDLIAFFPGTLNEEKLIGAFLKELDKCYPYYGVITREWSTSCKMYGKTYIKDQPDLSSALKTPTLPVKK